MTINTEDSIEESVAWWGEHALALEEAGRFQIGSFELTASRNAFEWRVAWQRSTDGDLARGSVECPLPATEVEVEVQGELLRLVTSSESRRLAVQPQLANRPVVVRPETIFRLLPGAEIRLYVSMPVWVLVEVDEPPRQVLDEATWRLPDTWFGGPTSGELCFAIKINARLYLENLPIFAHRAITVVVLKNRSETVLPIERLKLPAPNLSLYADSASHLWTQVVCVESDREGQIARVDIGQGPPEEAADARLVAGARVPTHQNLLVRALGNLLI